MDRHYANMFNVQFFFFDFLSFRYYGWLVGWLVGQDIIELTK